MKQEEKTILIKYLIDSHSSGKNAAYFGIVYSVLNKTFSIEIDGEQYTLTANQLADLPSGVGDEYSERIKTWAC
jgi:hypothetical protein